MNLWLSYNLGSINHPSTFVPIFVTISVYVHWPFKSYCLQYMFQQMNQTLFNFATVLDYMNNFYLNCWYELKHTSDSASLVWAPFLISLWITCQPSSNKYFVHLCLEWHIHSCHMNQMLLNLDYCVVISSIHFFNLGPSQPILQGLQ